MPTYFSEFGIHQEFTHEMVDVALAGLWKLRDAVDQAIEHDKPILLNIGMLGPDFNRVYTHVEVWPAAELFDWAKFQNECLTRPHIRRDVLDEEKKMDTEEEKHHQLWQSSER